MNADYAFCKHEGCKVKVLNKSGRCREHNKKKCRWSDCTTMITGKQGGEYCEKHRKVMAKRRDEEVIYV